MTSDVVKQCPAGHYCPTGTFIPIACPIGTYSATLGAIAQTTCISCPAGSFCLHRGQTTIGSNCNPGYFCNLGSTDPYQNRCPAGAYCV